MSLSKNVSLRHPSLESDTQLSEGAHLAKNVASTLSFLNLPNEIYDLIFAQVDSRGLQSLRLACKALKVSSTHMFGRVSLSRLRFIFTEYSLQGLVDLCSHSTLGPYVQNVSFGTHRLPFLFAPDSMNWHMLEIHSPVEMAEHNARAKVQSQFIETRGHIALLTKAFVILKQYGKKITVGVHDGFLGHDPEMQRKAYGFEKSYGNYLLKRLGNYPLKRLGNHPLKRLGNYPLKRSGVRVEDTIKSLGSALRESSFLFHALELDCLVESSSLFSAALRYEFRGLCHAVHHLMGARSEDHNMRNEITIIVRLFDRPGLVRVNSSNRRLEISNVGDQFVSPAYDFGTFALISPDSRFLREMIVNHATFSSDSLYEFLSENAPNLSKLEFSDVVIQDYMTQVTPSRRCLELLLFFKNKLHLEKLTLEYLRFSGFGDIQTLAEKKLSWQGQTNIAEQLGSLINSSFPA